MRLRWPNANVLVYKRRVARPPLSVHNLITIQEQTFKKARGREFRKNSPRKIFPEEDPEGRGPLFRLLLCGIEGVDSGLWSMVAGQKGRFFGGEMVRTIWLLVYVLALFCGDGANGEGFSIQKKSAAADRMTDDYPDYLMGVKYDEYPVSTILAIPI